MVWEKLAGVRNEPLDTTVYALAAANLVGVQRIRWSSEERKLEEQEVSSGEVGDAIAPSKKVRRSSRRLEVVVC
ncbi:bacteriophage tail assembly protein [Xenococcus sp. PCC 7305]|nr:bacteriophage tail assembly protein [Xenococcus sp. PCC 7305]